MYRFLVFFAVFTLFVPRADAQEVLQEPLCFMVRSEAAYKVYGSIVTDYYTNPTGTRARHRSNFRLEPVGTLHEDGYPLDRAEFCSYGPFYPDRKLDIVLRTLIPIFECRTRVDQGELVITGERNAEDTGNVTEVACFE